MLNFASAQVRLCSNSYALIPHAQVPNAQVRYIPVYDAVLNKYTLIIDFI
jgi:hypothetical protein